MTTVRSKTGHMALCGMLCISLAGPLMAGDASTRNAIFNGDFTEGVAAWSKLGPGHDQAELVVDKQQFAHVLINELVVSCPQMQRTFTVYNTYLLDVRQGGKYSMTIQASGAGQFSFGAFEFGEDGHHIGNNYSPRYVLTSELKTYTFTYKPSPNARSIRPAIVFLEPTDGSAVDVKARIRRVAMPVAEDEFDVICASWPEYARSNRFADYNGFSQDECEELEALGNIDVVLPPYEPIRAASPDDLTLTTSRVQFDGHILPQRVTILDEPVLASPMKLSVHLSDGTAMEIYPQRLSASSTDTKAQLRQTFASDNGAMTVTVDMDYDALMIVSLHVDRQPGASIASASLSIPFREDVGKYIRYSRMAVPDASGYGDWVLGYGPIPNKGETVETKSVIGSVHMGRAVANDWKPDPPGDDGMVWQWSRRFVHTVWIGDETRGISLISLSDQGYRAAADDITAQLERSDDAITLKYHFITDDVPLDSDHTLQFALQFMPPKPVREQWTAARFNSFFSGYVATDDPCLDILDELLPTAGGKEHLPYGRAYDVVRRQAIPIKWMPRDGRPYRDTGFLWFTLWAEGSRGWQPNQPNQPVGGCSTPLVGHPQRLARLMDHAAVLGHQALPYFAGTHIAAEDPAGFHYVERADEWTAKPRIPRPAYLRPTCPNSMFANYMARGIGRMIDEYDIKGVYFDNCAPLLCTNTEHGCGYVDDEGNVHPTLPLLGFRRLFMMVRNEFVKRGKDPYIMTHAGMQPGIVSFIDVELQGEGTYGSDHTEMFSLGEWRAMWLGQNQYGVQLSYLPAFGYGLGPNIDMVEQERIGTPCLMAIALLHGTRVWNQYIHSPVLYKAWTVLDELDASQTTFVPYWDWPAVNVPINPRKVYASAYRDDDRLILVLSNLSAETQDVAIPMSDIAAGRHVEDHMHDLPVRIEDGALRCAIEPKNFRLLSFTSRQDER